MEREMGRQSRVYQYGRAEMDYLTNACPKMGQAVAHIGHIERAVIPNLYAALLNSIVGQQISSKALATVWGRIEDKFVPLTPQVVAQAPVEDLQGCGMSMRKAGYIREVSLQVLQGSLDLDALQHMADDEVCARLCEIKGIGRWTAEMLLIFSMQRADVMSFGDLALHRGLRMLYRHKKITPALFARYKRRFSPHATVASLYLWQIAVGACPWLSDPAEPKKKPKVKA